MQTIELRPGGKEWGYESGPKPAVRQGKEQDVVDMRRMGKKQEFRRNFKVVSISSFCVVTMMGWVFIPINAPLMIEIVGTGGCIVIFLANFAGFLSIVLSLAEMSSIAPTAGGQYHWTSEFAPASIQQLASYVSGWLSSLSWLVGVASAMFIAGNIIPTLISLAHPAFVPQPYQGYLFIVAICIVCFLINAFLAKHLPLIEGFVLCFTVMVFISIVIVLLVLSPKLTGSEVFQTFTPSSELGTSGGLELVAAQVLLLYSLVASDSAAHMAEETQHAAVIIPRAMVWSYGITGLLDFIVLLAVCFTWIAPDIYANPPSGYAFLEQFTTATGSAEGAITLTSIMLVLIGLSVTNFMASTSRQIFAFARDEGLPFSRWVSKVNERTMMPVNSLIVVFVFVILICLIGLGSVVAFNAIVSLQVMALAGTYEVSLVSLIWRRLYGKPLPPAPWSLGRWGLPLNVFGVLYGLYLLAYSAMPSVYPVTTANFNWAPVMFGAVMLLSLSYYALWARKLYKGPVVHASQD
ncbi:putative GABA permease [Polychaeton citri CBS 116435]|uniref:GABA permease n=1 Tax=Polychaeton citri CBS 116435 TaxID=1314669 RepID=A0A9P4QAQ1_9PEZI|nr:putative GABA permease [Polychaeton citri CBS 116435]